MTVPDEAVAAVKATAVGCPVCGSKPGRLCYGNGDMAKAHPIRARIARDQAVAEWARRDALRDAARIAQRFDRGQTDHFKLLDRLALDIAAAIRDEATQPKH